MKCHNMASHLGLLGLLDAWHQRWVKNKQQQMNCQGLLSHPIKPISRTSINFEEKKGLRKKEIGEIVKIVVAENCHQNEIVIIPTTRGQKFQSSACN